MLQKIALDFLFQKINISTCFSKEILNDTCARVMYACIYIMCVFYIQSFLKKARGGKKHEEHITYGIPYRLSWCLPFPACNFLNFTSSPQFQYTRHFNQICKLAFSVSFAAPAPINLFSYMTKPIQEKLIIAMPRVSSRIINNVLIVMWLSG